MSIDSGSEPTSPLARLLEHRLSPERLAPYRRAVGGDLEPAVELYTWNAEVAAAFFEVLGHLEVVLRNALHEELSSWHASNRRRGLWFDDPARLLDERRRADIDTARARLLRDGKTETPGKVVAELSFGFWRFLLDRRYQNTLWAQALRHAFPFLVPQRRQSVYQPVERLTRLRNRIAHHEPIHHLKLAEHHDDVLRLAGFIDPALEAWLSRVSRVPAMLAGRP